MEPQQNGAPAPQMQAPTPTPAPFMPQGSMPNSVPGAPGGVPQGFAPVPTPATGKSHTGMILAIIGGVVGVLVVALVIVTLLFGNSILSASAANKFQKAMANGDLTAAESLSADGQSADTKAYLTTASADVKGSYHLSDSTLKDGTRYSLYTLDNSKNKSARVTVEKKGSKWLVTAYVYGPTVLPLIPGAAAKTSAQTTTTTTASACLTTADYDAITQALINQDNTLTWSADNPYTSNVHFNPNSLDYDYDALENDTIDGFIAFYKANPTKAYTIHLQGSVGTTAAADLAFGTRRAQKVQAQLEAGGVPASYIVIDPSQNVSALSDDPTNDIDQQIARSVVLSIIPGDCTK